jgi:hypothetical protein
MANVKEYKVIGAPFSNEVVYERITYDFAVDAGAVGVLNLFTATDKMALVSFHAVVKTACTSGGSMTLDCGIVTTDTNRFMASVAVASLGADTLHIPPLVEGTPNTALVPSIIADNAVIAMEIKTATLTAGKIEFVFGFMKA